MPSQSLKIALLMGGRSGEHEVSLVSGYAIAAGLRELGHSVTQIGITKEGDWVLPSDEKLKSYEQNPRGLKLSSEDPSFIFENLNLKKYDLVFPVLHGTFGEDGTLQGLLEMLQIPYVGSGVLASSLCMDKDLAKKIFESAGIPVVPYKIYHRRDLSHFQNPSSFKALVEELGLPLFVKPANAGSSVGVTKVKSLEDLKTAFQTAFAYDTKTLVEKAVSAREIECSVLGNSNPEASTLGEIIPRHEFYSYKAKYLDDHGADLKIPAQDLSPTTIQKIRDFSLKAFLAAECSGLARVDFFVDRNSGEIYLNEINTMPGFTPISMYPKLWEATGKNFKVLLTKLLDLALERFEERKSIKTSFAP